MNSDVLVAAKSLQTPPPAMFGSRVLKLFHISLMSVEFTPSKRGRVLQLHELNYSGSYREIEKITGVSKTTAQETVKQDENCNTHESLPRSGRPKAVNHCGRRHILWQVCQHQFEPYKAIVKHIGSVTEHQVRTVANEAGYHCHVAVHKPFLTAAAVKKMHNMGHREPVMQLGYRNLDRREHHRTR